VLETTYGGKELVDAFCGIARGVMPNVAVQEGSRPRKDQQVRPADQLEGHRNAAGPWLRQVTAAARRSPQCL
jgi:hypothetical protein